VGKVYEVFKGFDDYKGITMILHGYYHACVMCKSSQKV